MYTSVKNSGDTSDVTDESGISDFSNDNPQECSTDNANPCLSDVSEVQAGTTVTAGEWAAVMESD